jgi:hypothetical protein
MSQKNALIAKPIIINVVAVTVAMIGAEFN